MTASGQGAIPASARTAGAERVLVAMSGGVDSSLAAAIAVEQGYEVIGVNMHLAGESSRCCSAADADDARRVAEKLGIRFYVANYSQQFRTEVIERFADDYLRGRTPIPCVACNKRFKFDLLSERAELFRAVRVATGHYARIDVDPITGLHRLLRALDRHKDQSYFLFPLDQRQLARAWFPLGEMSKDQVRARARALGLTTADKAESQEICFVPDGDYASLVERIRPEAASRSGEFVDEAGRVLGRHGGVHRFTVGQRRGLGIAAGRRLYVNAIDPRSQRITVGDETALEARGADIEGVSWISGKAPDSSCRAQVQVRYRHAPAPALLEVKSEDRVCVHFDQPVRAISPGQAAVFYDAEVVLGGGWISGSIR